MMIGREAGRDNPRPTNAARAGYARQSARMGRPRPATLQSQRAIRPRIASFALPIITERKTG